MSRIVVTGGAGRMGRLVVERLLEQAQRAREGSDASEGSVRRTLHQLGYRWKRPRYVLSRRSPTWRQSKGGSSAA